MCAVSAPRPNGESTDRNLQVLLCWWTFGIFYNWSRGRNYPRHTFGSERTFICKGKLSLEISTWNSCLHAIPTPVKVWFSPVHYFCWWLAVDPTLPTSRLLQTINTPNKLSHVIKKYLIICMIKAYLYRFSFFRFEEQKHFLFQAFMWKGLGMKLLFILYTLCGERLMRRVDGGRLPVWIPVNACS